MWGTVSKALEKSRIVIYACLPLSKDFIRLLTVVISCILHENPDWNQWLRLVRILVTSRWDSR